MNNTPPSNLVNILKRNAKHTLFTLLFTSVGLSGSLHAEGHPEKNAEHDAPKLTKEQVIEKLSLEHHFEGGYFRQTFKANHRDKVTTTRGERTTMTAIFYMLTEDNNIDHFHTKYSDGIEFYHMGAPITYHMIYPDGHYEKVVVGPDIFNGQQLQLAVPGGTYKAAELTSGSYGLVSEAVAPGWEKEDMIDVSRDELLSKFPQHKVIIERLANKK